MSYSSATPTVPTAIGAAHRWGWFVGLGVVLIALGVFAWFEVVAVTVAGAIFLGAAMFVGGVFQIIHDPAYPIDDVNHQFKYVGVAPQS